MKQKLGNRKAAEHEIRPLQFTWKNTEEKKNSYKIIFYILTEVQLGAFSFCFFFFCVLAVSVQSLGPAALGSVQTHNVISKIMFSQTIISKVTSQYSL